MSSTTLSASGRAPHMGAAKCIPIRRERAVALAAYSRHRQGRPP